MAIIIDYGTLKAAVGDWLSAYDLVGYIPNFIQNAENRIYRELRVRQMMTTATINIVAPISSANLPVGYLEFQRVAVSSTNPLTVLERADNISMLQTYPVGGITGPPRLYTTSRTSITVSPLPDIDYTLSVLYYKRENAMTDPGDTPWIITDAADLVLFASLCAAVPFIKDDARLILWEQQYQQQKDLLQQLSDREQFSGSKPRARFR